ncbi:hypothetical protein [Paenibacillus antarcticus]|uniref:hypothetical protein n=1 Tax=Paenibacillus antarcticus TaxID=253703 RepID=UPI0011F2A38C|nr:hypothetical protein [Paenibacillus antarcticus]
MRSHHYHNKSKSLCRSKKEKKCQDIIICKKKVVQVTCPPQNIIVKVLKGPTGANGVAGVAGATGATGSTPTTFTKAILFGGANTGFQRVSGSPGALSQTIPFVDAANGNIVGFSGSINTNNLPVGSYLYQICFDVINNAVTPLVNNIISTITLMTTAVITGTIIFSIRPSDIGSQPVRVSNNAPYVLAPATVTWTSNIVGDPVIRNDAISLFLNMNVTQSAVYSVFISSDI